MRHRIYLPLLVLLWALAAVSPAIAQSAAEAAEAATVTAQTESDNATEQTAEMQRPGPVVKVIKHQTEAPSMRSLVAVRDAETGEFRAPTDAEWAELASSMDPLNRSDAGLVETHYADGTVGVKLHGRFQNMMMVRKSAAGDVEAVCTHGSHTAANFLIGTPSEANKAVAEESEARDDR